MSNLLIVESPGKVKKIQSFLGTGWQVLASVGHVRDLPQKQIGVSAPDFRPTYEATDRGADVLKRLAAAVARADEIYLATDPDREGEAIAWHVVDALKIKNAKRVTYQEITEKAVKAAIAKPRSLDMSLVAAQEGRRVLDRLCGYLVSGPLSNASGQRLSAGRVQSPAVRLVVEREREIKNFKATTHFGAELDFAGNWTATWKPVLKDTLYIVDKSLAEQAAAIRNLTVKDYKESESHSAPPAPFTTSSLQQAASNTLKLTPKQTMQIAQRLYEQGAITYMRTDSPNLSSEAIEEIRAYCERQGWQLVDKPRVYKAKDGAQEAHEAIRPVHIDVEDAGETADEQALYRLIRIRTLASQLADAIFAVRTATLESTEHIFEAKGRTLKEKGWKVVLAEDDTEETDAEPDNPVPALEKDTQIQAENGKVIEKTTKPAPRFTEASLVKELEKRGIGRPSTYASIIDTITTREYVKTEKRQLVPTAVGEAVVDGLVGKFSFADYEFTRQMETALDEIAEGKVDYKAVMGKAHGQLEQELKAFATATGGKLCPECGKPLARRTGTSKAGKPYDFWGCTGFRDGCKYSENADGTTGRAAQADDPNAPTCPDCGKPMRRRSSATGAFYGCSGYPECKKTIAISSGPKPAVKTKSKR